MCKSVTTTKFKSFLVDDILATTEQTKRVSTSITTVLESRFSKGGQYNLHRQKLQDKQKVHNAGQTTATTTTAIHDKGTQSPFETEIKA